MSNSSFRLAAIAALTASLFAAAPVLAQNSTEKPTRSGSLAPAGEGPGAMASAPTKGSDRSRASVKAQTKAAEATGGLTPAGQATQPVAAPTREGGALATTGSTKSRSAVKAQTKAAERSGTLQPAGDTPNPVNEPPKK